MTPKQRKFIEVMIEIWPDDNPHQAYKLAGYRGLGASASAAISRMLKDVNVKSAIEAGIAKKTVDMEEAEQARTTEQFDQLPTNTKRTLLQVNRSSVLSEAATIAFSTIGDLIDFSGPSPRLRPANEISPLALKSVSSVKVKHYQEGVGETARDVELLEFRFWDKNSAIMTLAKALNLFEAKTPLEELLNVINSINPAFGDELRRYLAGRRLGGGSRPAVGASGSG